MQRLKALHAVAAEDRLISKAKDRRAQDLDLRGLSLAQIPDSACCGTLVHCLTSLDISHNQLTCLPSCIGQLCQLEVLRASRNALSALPRELDRLCRLKDLDCSHNRLTDIPSCLDSLQYLERLNFSGNCITRLRASSFGLPRLKRFHVTRNAILNVPQDVYINGLQAIRSYFGLNISVPQQVCEDVVNTQYSSLQEELQHLQLKHVQRESKLKAPSATTGAGDCQTSAFRTVRNSAAVHKPLQRLESDGLVSTSDYGSCTGSQLGSGIQDDRNDVNSCCGDQGSDAGDVTPNSSDEEGRCDHCHQPLIPEVDFDDDECVDFILPNRARFLKCGLAAVLIPEHNKSNILRSEFFIEFEEGLQYVPELEDHVMQAGPVVFLGPHGAAFYKDSPAIIRLPLHVDIGVSRIRCFTSDTDDLEPPNWVEIPSCDFSTFREHVLIRTQHFSLFTVVLDSSAPVVSRTIKWDVGGKLVVEQVPGVAVDFPVGSLTEDVDASIKVLCSELSPDMRTNIHPSDALASPVVVLSPHGYFFKGQIDSKVMIHLPVPHYNRIVQQFGIEAQLTVWHSPTAEGEPVLWEKLDVDYEIVEDEYNDCVVSIPVEHFSWFTTLWNGIKQKLNNTGMAMGFYSGGAVSMKCQAWMLENPDTDKFGLVVICHRSDDNSMQDVGNYAKNVGGSLKPVSILPGGDIIVKLGRSEYFEADTQASEDPSLEKEEANYNGREFEMQFALRFRGNSKPRVSEIFGKVFVKRRRADGTEERLFEFNLIKKSDEVDDTPEDPWTAASLKELADLHGITNSDNWKMFARALGFNLQDIRTKLGRAADPFAEIVVMYRRQGGEYDEFLHQLNAVGRKLRISDDPPEDPSAPSGSGEGQGLMQMLSWKNWFGSGAGGRGSPSQSGSSSPRSLPEDDENQPGPSGLQSGKRKRLCVTCEAGPSPTTPNVAKRIRLSPTTSESSGGSEDTVHHHGLPPHFRQDQSPPRTPNVGAFCSLPTSSRYSPPHISNTGLSGVHLTQSRGNIPVFTPGPGMSGLPSHNPYGAGPSGLPASSSVLYNTPHSSVQYGAIPNTAQQAMPVASDPESLLKANQQEITQTQLYHIASLIQNNWVKVARYIRDDETLETDIKSIRDSNPSNPEEQATQMLLQWREKCPDRCYRGMLYGALCDLNLKSVAKKCEAIYRKSR
ncbi:uncharacterized protein [Diadema setosum]|uniref:uncharacterized protein n=1 Tax=Diadema setosum TaxID=31175 RepID=UPI003B3A8882